MTWYDNPISMGIMKKKYLHEGEEPRDFIPRVTSIFSETLQPIAKKMMEEGNLLPAGRTLYGAGYKGERKVSLSNCYILPTIEDNIENIFETAKRIARISSYGGGCGIDVSHLRPKDAVVNNSAKTSTGAVSFLNLFDVTSGTIGQNGRRGALMVGLDCTHPDIEEFLHIKQNNDKLASMNISIKFTNEFMEAVKANSLFTLYFVSKETGRIEKEIDARKFFMEFCETQWDWGDPGALFINRIREYNLLSGYDDYKIDITNPCVTGNTLILTDKGYLPIKELVGQSVNVWNGFEWSTVTPKVTGHNQKMLRVTLSNGMVLDCTRYHKFILSNESRVAAEKLSIGDRLQKWTYPVISGCEGYHSVYHDAYTNGFYSGDGTVNRHEIVLYGVKQELIKYLNIDHALPHVDHTKVVLAEYPLGKGWVPSISESVNYRLEWLAGIIDSDGCMNDVGGSVSISSINREFLSNIQLMLNTLGCSSSVGQMHISADKMLPANDGTGTSKLFHCQNCYRLVISAWNVMKLIELGLNTHRVRINPHPQRNAGRFVTVVNITPIEDAETVFCFDEPLNHSGIFNGIMTAQCSEFPGNGGNSCNLSSINLYNVIDHKFTDNARINFDSLREITDAGVRMLDEILDYGRDMQPLDMNKKCIDDWRSIGLGVFGLADALIAMGIRYGSKKSLAVVKEIMRVIAEQAVVTSSSLAREKGSFGKYDWEKTKKSPILHRFSTRTLETVERYGLRNGTLLSIAPTGTLSLFAGGFAGGIEPLYQVAYQRTTHSMEDKGKTFTVYAKSVHDLLIAKGLHDLTTEEIKERFPFIIESHEIPPLERIELQSTMQKYVDCAISSTVNLPNSATPQNIYDIYMNAWEKGLKGITVFRDGCKRGNILGVQTGKDKEAATYNTISPANRRNTKVVNGSTFKQSSACVPSMYITVNKTDEGDIFEVFTNASGGCTANISTITRLISLALRSGIKVDKIVEELRENRCPACQTLRKQGQTVSLSCGNAIADAIENMMGKEHQQPSSSGSVCPECGKDTLRPEGNCVTCSNCGWSKCS